jgi:hypothetical protein
MTQARIEFQKSTKQYFQNGNKNNQQSKDNNLDTNVKKIYIKEEPFINSSEVEYR